jgi:pyrimidine operon attenuation protein/uracil phosphoribosyltransferase
LIKLHVKKNNIFALILFSMSAQLQLLNADAFNHTIKRLCYELIENHNNFENTVIIGLQPRGIYLSSRICKELAAITGKDTFKNGHLDVTFYRDDFRKRESPLVPNRTQIDFIIEDKNVILVDDVLYTGRTIRAGMDALLAFGRPKKVELMVLIDRRYSRHLPIQPDYVGKVVDTITSDNVKVKWHETDGQDGVLMITENENTL